MRKSLFATASLATALTLSACGGGGDTSATAAPESTTGGTASTPAATPSESAAADPMTTATGDPFGAACSQVPTEGEGSVSGMADDPVATAASNNPLLTTLVSAVTEANLVDTLNSAEDITVFAPTNEAFGALDPATLNSAMADPSGLLTDVLTYHVVPMRLGPDAVAGEHETLNGATLTVEGSGEEFTVNGDAAVVCGNVQTANATVYLIDSVLLPQS